VVTFFERTKKKLKKLIGMAEQKMERLARVIAQLEGAGSVAGPHFPTRCPVMSAYGAVASSQPLASQIGLRILEQGGNACDACVGIAAALNVTEPSSTGIGGDCFCLFYDAKTKKVTLFVSSYAQNSNRYPD